MKTIFLFFILIFSSFSVADTTSEMIEQFMREREKMFDQIQKSFFSDDGLFKDDFPQIGFGSEVESDLKIKQRQKSDTEIEVLITPSSKDINISVEMKEGYLQINGKKVVREEKESKTGISSSSYESQFSRSIGLAEGYEITNQKLENQTIVVTLTKTDKNSRRVEKEVQDGIPLEPKKGDITI